MADGSQSNRRAAAVCRGAQWQPLLAPKKLTMALTVMITLTATSVEAQSSSDLLLVPRERSTGYFCSFTSSFASAAATGSMPSAADS